MGTLCSKAVLVVALLGGANSAGPDATTVTRPPATIDIEKQYDPFEPIIATVRSEATVYMWDFADSYQAVEVNDGKTIHVWAPPGEHVVRCILLNIDWDKRTIKKQYIRSVFTVGDPEPDPEPQPNPDPEPNPTPRPAVFGVIIEERSDRAELTAKRAMVFESKVVRNLFPAGAFHVRDDDVKDETGSTPADFAPYITRARKLGLPAMFLVDRQGKVLFEGAVPKDVPTTVGLVRKYLEN